MGPLYPYALRTGDDGIFRLVYSAFVGNGGILPVSDKRESIEKYVDDPINIMLE